MSLKREVIKVVVGFAIWLLFFAVIWATPDCGCDCDFPTSTYVVMIVMLSLSAYGLSRAVDKLIDWGME